MISSEQFNDLMLIKTKPRSEWIVLCKFIIERENDPEKKAHLISMVEMILSGVEIRVKQIIVLVHGILTFGNWQNKAKKILSGIENTEVFIVKYGYFDAIRFYIPFFTRKGPIKKVREEINSILNGAEGGSISFVAHSFGTYITTSILKQDEHLKINNFILCGSIVPRNFPWNKIKNRITGAVINEVGTEDIWPIIARCSWGYDCSGRTGFGTSSVVDRHHKLGHSGFFCEKFMSSYWVPLFTSNTVVESEWDQRRNNEGFFVSLFTILPLNIILVLSLVFFLWIIF